MIRDLFMSEQTSASIRPLSAGEVLDRALTLVAAKPFSIIALMMIALTPDVILHLYQSFAWVAQYANAPMANIGGLPFGPAGEVYYQLNLISVGSVADVAPYVADFLRLVLTGACAVIIAYGLANRRATIAEALRRLNDRWIPVSLIAVAGVLVLHGVQLGSIEFGRVFESSARQYFASGGSMQLFIAESLMTAFLFAFAQNALWIVAAGIIASVMLEAESIQEAIARELRSIAGYGRIGGLILFSVAFAFLAWIFRTLALGWSLALYYTHAPILDTIYYLAINAVPQAFLTAAAIVFYLDSRLRQGVNVPEDFVATQELESIGEGSAE